MNDLIGNDSFEPANKLEKYGVRAAACVAGGVAFLALGIIGARVPVVGLALGGLLSFLGVGALLSKDPDDKKPGVALAAGGILLLLSRLGPGVVRPLAATLFDIGAVGLLAMGIVNGIRFLLGLKKRS